jgi:hypothetical protein
LGSPPGIRDAAGVEDSLFDEVGDALLAMVPADLGELRQRAHRYGIKLWFESEKPPREHYEAQVIGPDGVKGAKVLALEVGFHSEYAKTADNDAVIAHLRTAEKKWRRVLGTEARIGPFLGRRDDWRRVSETWPDPDLEDGDLVIELATRLVDYVTALEPVRRTR